MLETEVLITFNTSASAPSSGENACSIDAAPIAVVASRALAACADHAGKIVAAATHSVKPLRSFLMDISMARAGRRCMDYKSKLQLGCGSESERPCLSRKKSRNARKPNDGLRMRG